MVLIPRLDLMPRLMNGDMYVCIYIYIYIYGDRGSTVVKVLCYESEGRWFDPSWCH